MPEQAPEDRARNFQEVPYGYTLNWLRRSRPADALPAKSRNALKAVPLTWIFPAHRPDSTRSSRGGTALKEQNALPPSGVCPQEEQCESKCILGIKGDPVAVGRLERFVADYERNSGAVATPEIPAKTGKRVAIIGACPAGLTAAGDLIRMGHEVTVFEALQETGGVLVYGIPEFRLPKEIVKAEVNFLKQMGVKFVMDFVVGRNATIRELLDEEGYDAVFIGTGAGLPALLGIPGENLVGVYSANEYLTRSNLMKSYLFPKYDTPPIRRERVAVVGGGNVAMDAARTALASRRRCAYCLPPRQGTDAARIEEVHHAEEEGVKMRLLTNPKRIFGDERHRVTGIECIQMELESLMTWSPAPGSREGF